MGKVLGMECAFYLCILVPIITSFSSVTSTLPWASCGNWWNSEACRRVDSTNCTAHFGLMTSAGDCILQKDVTIDVWRNITEELNQSKMPSDEFFHNFMLDIS